MPKAKDDKRIGTPKPSMSSFATPMAAILRSDKNDLPQYNNFECMVKNDVTVADSKGRRFAGIYPGLALDVLDGDGNAVAGDTKLRDSYADG
jgi:hypothetical protein